jgi:Amt family ammonium transporter
MGIRVEPEAEINGLDMAEMGMEAYPDFTKG